MERWHPKRLTSKQAWSKHSPWKLYDLLKIAGYSFIVSHRKCNGKFQSTVTEIMAPLRDLSTSQPGNTVPNRCLGQVRHIIYSAELVKSELFMKQRNHSIYTITKQSTVTQLIDYYEHGYSCGYIGYTVSCSIKSSNNNPLPPLRRFL